MCLPCNTITKIHRFSSYSPNMKRLPSSHLTANVYLKLLLQKLLVLLIFAALDKKHPIWFIQRFTISLRVFLKSVRPRVYRRLKLDGTVGPDKPRWCSATASYSWTTMASDVGKASFALISPSASWQQNHSCHITGHLSAWNSTFFNCAFGSTRDRCRRLVVDQPD